jgi:hypothetical protein
VGVVLAVREEPVGQIMGVGHAQPFAHRECRSWQRSTVVCERANANPGA